VGDTSPAKFREMIEPGNFIIVPFRVIDTAGVYCWPDVDPPAVTILSKDAPTGWTIVVAKWDKYIGAYRCVFTVPAGYEPGDDITMQVVAVVKGANRISHHTIHFGHVAFDLNPWEPNYDYVVGMAVISPHLELHQCVLTHKSSTTSDDIADWRTDWMAGNWDYADTHAGMMFAATGSGQTVVDGDKIVCQTIALNPNTWLNVSTGAFFPTVPCIFNVTYQFSVDNLKKDFYCKLKIFQNSVEVYHSAAAPQVDATEGTPIGPGAITLPVRFDGTEDIHFEYSTNTDTPPELTEFVFFRALRV